ncbi:ABC transporter substrate-binding protein [Streptomyces sp. NPDC060366]|uniref:ABC transporter substrate-binding protein n=1 Tax=Streptomyces sp. NPDC060366 TaxID=3347105 RepID=UPI00364FD24B
MSTQALDRVIRAMEPTMAVLPRTAAFIAATTAVILAMAGTVTYNIANNSSNADAVTWWVPDWDYDAARKLVATYENENPGTTVNLVKTTGDTVANRTSVALNSGDVPDVITESTSRIKGYAAKGQLTDLSGQYGPSMPKSDFAPGLVNSLTAQGKTYAVPYRWATNALIYNPDLFEAAGIDSPPTTWAEFEEDAKRLTKGNVVGTAWPIQGDPSDLTLRLLDFAISDGSTIKNGAPKLTEPSVKNALDLIGGSITERWASPSSFELDNTAIHELFLQGRVAMYQGGVFDVDDAVTHKAPIATAELPGPDTSAVGTAQGSGWAYIVPAKAQHKDAAEKLVAFLGEPANMAALTLTFPARLSAFKDAKFQTELREPYVRQLTDHSTPAPDDPRWTATIPGVHNEIQKVGLGQRSSSAAAKNIVAQADKALGR